MVVRHRRFDADPASSRTVEGRIQCSVQNTSLIEGDGLDGFARFLAANPTATEFVALEISPTDRSRTLHARILSGSFVLILGSGLATAANFVYNMAVARFLGPTGYGHATAVYTLLILTSAATLSFQIISAKVVAQQSSLEAKAAVYRAFHHAAWACGIALALLLLVFQSWIAAYLNLPSPVLVALLAAGVAFYVPLGSRRGYIQGVCGFRILATNMVLEGVVRLFGSLLLVKLGFGVRGVVAANAAAVAVAYFAAIPRSAPRVPNPLQFQYALRETFQALIFFSGQVLINNCDIVLVKHFFLPTTAGLYAAVAMVGRVIFSFSFAVVNSMFPLVAGTRQEERRGLKAIATSCLLVLVIGSAFALGLRLAPAAIWTTMFGSGFAISGQFGLPYLLALYAITTVVYSLSVVITIYEMSYKIANASWIQLAFSGVVIAGICRFHSSLREVIWVQLVVMIVLLVVVAVPFILSSLSESRMLQGTAGAGPIRIMRRVSEDQVIAEFLRNDINSPAFHDYRESLGHLVTDPNLDDPSENAKRKALFFIRHRALWKELPRDTEWYEVELRPAEFSQIRFFPRAQWRKLAKGDFSAPAVVERLRSQENLIHPGFRSKIDSIRKRLGPQDAALGTVVLIGISEKEPVTVLDGNHRLAAAMLASSPDGFEKLRFLCGLSPTMTRCCWYNTNLVTLLRYGKNIVGHIVRDPEAELARLLQTSG
jgi:O-antigen/teichoic acid export membrane protein